MLVSNTSSIPIVKLGAVSGRPNKVMGVHFFNPAPVMQLVELIPSLTTGADTVERMRGYVTEQLGKQPIDATDRAGFVVNSLLVPYLLSAIRMYEAGYASAKDIDQGMVLGCGHPMGPLALCDLIGLDTIRAIGVSMYSGVQGAAVLPAAAARPDGRGGARRPEVEAGLLPLSLTGSAGPAASFDDAELNERRRRTTPVLVCSGPRGCAAPRRHQFGVPRHARSGVQPQGHDPRRTPPR